MIPGLRKISGVLVHFLLLAAGVVFGVWALFNLYLYVHQERLLFYPTPMAESARMVFPAPFEEHFIPVEGARLHALRFPVPRPRGVVLFFHGNAGNLAGWGAAMGPFIARGYDAVFVDYRGFGKSGGRIQSQAQLLADAEAVYQWVLDRTPEDRVVLVGRSLGSGVAVHLASRHRPRLLLLQSAYVSMLDVKRRIYPYVPGFVLRYPMRSDRWIGSVGCPVFLIHGRRDELIPFSSSERLLPLIRTEKRLFPVDAGHDDLAEGLDYEAALDAILDPRS